ncbi:MAG TPA: O-antigen ligase family protein [Gaiella sp.]|nr:O-antigen ligase family protein [Gaiella sp.]
MDAAPRPGRVAEAALLGTLGILLAWVVLFGGGSRVDTLATAGIAAIVCAAAGVAVALRGVLPLPRLDRPAATTVVAVAALALWAGVSIVWSIAGDLSWAWLARWLVYTAFLALGVLAGTLRGGAVRVASLAAVVLAAALGWALVGVAIPSLFPDGDRIARLRDPVGYWNALALLADAGIAFGLWVARNRRAPLRVAGSLLTFAAVLVILLTQSRAGVVGALAVVALWLVVSDERLTDALRMAVAAGPALAVAAWAFTRPALVEDGALRSDRVADGRVFAVVTVVAMLAVALVAWRLPVRGIVDRHSAAVRVTILAACALTLVAGSIGFVAKVGNPISWIDEQLSRGECVNEPGRLTDLCANNRLQWWGEALDVAADRPVGGSGAGTFALARRRYRESATPVTEPHSVPLQLLADLGVVGLGLGLAAVVGGALGARRGLRLSSGEETAAAAALACLPLAYVVHAVVDYDLDFLAVTGPALVALGALLSLGRPRVALRVRLPGLVAVAAIGVAAAIAVALPRLAQDRVDRAFAAIDAGRLDDAVDAADRAGQLDPLSLGPLQARAQAADAAGDHAAAVAWYEKATRLQPENPDTWYDLGLYHAIATRDMCAAYAALNHSYTLDPRSSRWAPGGPLDVARDAVNAGACER